MHAEWTIIGAGAIGCIWAWHWRQQQLPVTLIARQPDTVLRYRRADQSRFRQTTIRCLGPGQLQQPVSRLLVTTRADQTTVALQQLRPLLTPDCWIVVLQNGVSALDLSHSVSQPLFAASTSEAGYCTASCSVVHAARGTTHLGPVNQRARALAGEVRASFPDAIHTELTDDIGRELWRKFALNCVINALTVKYQCRNGGLLLDPAARAELVALCAETAAILYRHTGDPWHQQLFAHAEALLTRTAENLNSMLQASRAGKATELAALNGKLVGIASTLGMSGALQRRLLAELTDQTSEPEPDAS